MSRDARAQQWSVLAKVEFQKLKISGLSLDCQSNNLRNFSFFPLNFTAEGLAALFISLPSSVRSLVRRAVCVRVVFAECCEVCNGACDGKGGEFSFEEAATGVRTTTRSSCELNLVDRALDLTFPMAPPDRGAAAGDALATTTIRSLVERSAKRTHGMFKSEYLGVSSVPQHDKSVKLKMAVKMREYENVRGFAERTAGMGKQSEPSPETTTRVPETNAHVPGPSNPVSTSNSAIPGLDAVTNDPSDIASLIDAIDDDDNAKAKAKGMSSGLAVVGANKGATGSAPNTVLTQFKKAHETSAGLIPRLASKWPKPKWHAPWKLYRVISGHLGWVRSVTVDPSNEWFVTGSADRTIKIWDLASGQLKLTLTGHIEQVTGLAVSDRHPYMFSCGLDKQVKCWDLEYNKVIRHYHGHLSGVYSLALHPELDVLMTGGRDSACRVWDMRTKTQAMCLSGHDNTVGTIVSQRENPQVMTGSYDSTIKLWDLAAGKCSNTLTHHKKGVRALALHPTDFSLLSASADNIKKFGLSSDLGGNAKFKHNMLQKQKTIVNALSVNEDGVVVSGGDNGSVWFWDYESGHCFQENQSKVQPGSMESEAGVFASTFDKTGTRLITVEADKTIKMWKVDEDASEETHPNIPFMPPKDMRRF